MHCVSFAQRTLRKTLALKLFSPLVPNRDTLVIPLCYCHTRYCNVSPLFQSEHYTFLFPFESLTTHSCYYVVWNTFFVNFSNIFSVELFNFADVTLTQGSFNVFSLSPSEHSTLLLYCS